MNIRKRKLDHDWAVIFWMYLAIGLMISTAYFAIESYMYQGKYQNQCEVER